MEELNKNVDKNILTNFMIVSSILKDKNNPLFESIIQNIKNSFDEDQIFNYLEKIDFFNKQNKQPFSNKEWFEIGKKLGEI